LSGIIKNVPNVRNVQMSRTLSSSLCKMRDHSLTNALQNNPVSIINRF